MSFGEPTMGSPLEKEEVVGPHQEIDLREAYIEVHTSIESGDLRDLWDVIQHHTSILEEAGNLGEAQDFLHEVSKHIDEADTIKQSEKLMNKLREYQNLLSERELMGML